MSHVFNILAVFIIGYPAYCAGYLWACVASGFATGMFIYNRDEARTIEKFITEKGPQ